MSFSKPFITLPVSAFFLLGRILSTLIAKKTILFVGSWHICIIYLQLLESKVGP